MLAGANTICNNEKFNISKNLNSLRELPNSDRLQNEIRFCLIISHSVDSVLQICFNFIYIQKILTPLEIK